MSMQPSTTLAAFVAGLDYDAIPPAVRERVKDLLIDTVACSLAGHHGDETAQIREVAETLGGTGTSTIIGGTPLSLVGATFLNSYLSTAVTMCDVHKPTHCHITPVVIPSALAVAESRGASGRALITALVAGFEVMTRVAVGLKYPVFRARGWHTPGVVGPFGGAAAVGKLLGVDADTQRTAFGLAGSQSAGTFAAWGTPTVKFHQSRGAVSGLLAGLLGAQKFRASTEILTHPDGGILNVYSDGGDPGAVIADLGRHWELMNISYRLWPTASPIQALVDAILRLAQRHDLRAEQVAKVRVRVSKQVHDLHATQGWDNKFNALLSARYVAAVVLHDRQCWLEQFAPARLADPVVGKFATERVAVELDPAMSGMGANVEIITNAGATHAEHRPVAKGDASEPLTRAECVDKLRLGAKGLYGAAQTDTVIRLLSALETLGDVRELCRALAKQAG